MTTPPVRPLSALPPVTPRRPSTRPPLSDEVRSPAAESYRTGGRRAHTYTSNTARGVWSMAATANARAATLLARLHDRMPVVVHPNDYNLWMRGTPGEADVLLKPYPADLMAAAPVSARVNGPRNEGPELLAAV